MTIVLEIAAMRRALDHAAKGPVPGPAPRVGCVIVDTPGGTVLASLGIATIDRAARPVATDLRRPGDDVLVVPRPSRIENDE